MVGYKVLSDDNKKASYDQFGHAGVDPNGGGGGFGGGGFGGGQGMNGMDLNDLFEELFRWRPKEGDREGGE